MNLDVKGIFYRMFNPNMDSICLKSDVEPRNMTILKDVFRFWGSDELFQFTRARDFRFPQKIA